MDRIVIRNARIIDGADGETDADLLILDDRIQAFLPRGESVAGAEEVDGSGCTLVPGFIDIHRHADLKPFSNEPWDELSQGLTSMVSGNCGFSPTPNCPETFGAVRDYALPILGRIPDEICGMTTREFYQRVIEKPLKINVGYLVGNGALRRAVAGFSDKPLHEEQMQRICALLAEALEAGALGLSMGIMYTPECYFSTEELIRIASVAARFSRPVIAHIRGEGQSVLESVAEMIRIGKGSGARIHISHMKAAGTDMWGHAVDQMLAMIDHACAQGMDITFDAYPYTAGSTTLLSLLPPETLSNGTEGVLKQVASADGRAYILEQFRHTRKGWDNFIQTLGWSRVIISGSSNKHEIGKTVAALADEANRDPGEYALDLLEREAGCVSIVLEEMDPDDVRKILMRPECIVISDSLYATAGKPHPRRYGAFERFLAQYVKEEKLLSLQQGIQKMTAMPAEFLGLSSRGHIRAGYYADLVLMDWKKLRDRATYTEPILASEGIRQVYVNGKLSFENGSITGDHAGVLLGSNKSKGE